MKMRKKH